MKKAKVFFTDLRTAPGLNLPRKLEKLCREAGFASVDFKDKFTALKIHFGEPGNLAYLRPNYAAVVAGLVREAGGKPFLTDANTLYSGRRHNAVDHIRAALENGFSRDATGCDLIIADGLKGIDYSEIEIGLEHCRTAKIAAAIAQADALVSLNHFKGHELTGFGGALKNLGMGCASRGGKLELHSTSKPRIEREACVGCGLCVKNCAHAAVVLDPERRAVIDYERCVGCGQCIAVCRYEAAKPVWDNASALACKKIAEYAWAVLKDKSAFHLNFVMNVSPDCDCWDVNDQAIVPDVGMLASLDPVALDQASADAVDRAAAVAGSRLADKGWREGGGDKFKQLHPDADWRVGLEHAEKIGLGRREYELVVV